MEDIGRMNDEILIIKKQLKDMSAIYNAVPGESLDMPCIMPLMIMQRRMEECQLKDELTVFTDICSKEEPLSCEDIVKASVTLVRIQTIVEGGLLEFDAFSIRELIKHLKNHKTKASNLIHLSKVNALTADDFQKVQIEKTLDKNEKFLAALDEEIKKVEKEIERNPLPEEPESTDQKQETKEKKKERAPDSPFWKRIDSIKRRISDLLWNRANEDGLKDIEKEKSVTKLKEVPFYDAKLMYTQKLPCKDIPEFTILKRKNNVYFGLSKNVMPGFYDNRDESLIELTAVTEEFLQFMTQDLFSGEFLITEFSPAEKEGLILYLDFMSACFEWHIGKVLNVREYLSFKTYYNRIVRLMFDVEKEKKEAYYLALEVADKYMEYMEIYGLLSGDKEEIIEDIMAFKCDGYLDDIDLIIENHIVDADAKKDLLALKGSFMAFDRSHDDEVFTVRQVGAPEFYVEDETVTENSGDCQLVVQILDDERHVVDEAVYAGDNIKQALSDFDGRSGKFKRLGVRKNGEDVFYEEIGGIR